MRNINVAKKIVERNQKSLKADLFFFSPLSQLLLDLSSRRSCSERFVGDQSIKASRAKSVEMDHDKTGCQSPPEGPKLCINNCGFFGSAATMNMCSKCHKAILFQQEQGAKFASAVSGTTSSNNIMKETLTAALVGVETKSIEAMTFSVHPSSDSVVAEVVLAEEEAVKPKDGPSRCTTCNKRVGLTGFKCRCGNLFCGTHRYADIHDCSFNYHAAAQEAIAKANPVVKAEKLDKI